MMATQKACSFCVREGINPPAIGSRATGAFKSLTLELNRKGEFYAPVRVFNGYVCELHSCDVDWFCLNWQRDKPEFPFGEFDNGSHWKGN